MNPAEVCAQLGITRSALYKRMQRGWTLERIVSNPRYAQERHVTPKPKADPKNEPITVLCRNHGVSRRTYYTRMAQGWTKEQALGIEDRPHDWTTKDQAEISRLLRGWKR